MNLLASFCLFSSIIYLVLGLYAINREPNSNLTQTFFALTLSLAVWSGSDSYILSPNISEQIFWFKVSSLGWISLAAFYTHFALILTGKERFLKRWMIVLLYLPAVFEIICINTILLTDPILTSYKLSITELMGQLPQWFWIIHLLYTCIYTTVSLTIMTRWGIKSTKHREKRQAAIIVLSAIIVCSILIFNYFIIPDGYRAPWAVWAVGIIWAGGILFAMVKYKLMTLNPALVVNDILARVTDLVILIDPSDHIIMANAKSAEILGYSLDEMHNMSLLKIIPNMDVASIKDTLNQNNNMELVVDYQTGAGELIPVQAYLSINFDRLGDVVGILIVGQDLRMTRQLEQQIEDKIKAETALRKSEEKYRDLFEYANDIIYTHDLSANILSYNKAAYNRFGYFPNDKGQINLIDYVVPEQRQMFLEMIEQRSQSQQQLYYEISVYNYQKEELELEVSSRPIWENGELVAIQCIARDVTERKHMAEKLTFMSMHDYMTGLYNRAYFSEELNRMESGRFDPVGVIMCDLDDLKKTNDNYGHLAGDDMIVTAAEIIQSCFRSSDVVARIGGDEFVIITPYSDEDTCAKQVNAIKEALDKHNKTSSLFIGLSIGFAVRTSTIQSMHDVFKQADRAMYTDKALRKKLII